MATEQPSWDNLGRGEVSRDGGGLLVVALTPRIGGHASHSELVAGHHVVRSRTQTVPIIGAPDGLTRWEKTNAQLLSDPGYAFGTW